MKLLSLLFFFSYFVYEITSKKIRDEPHRGSSQRVSPLPPRMLAGGGEGLEKK